MGRRHDDEWGRDLASAVSMMAGEAPSFWWTRRGWQATLLAPAAAVYGAVARRRLDRGERADAGMPVLCVGNFIVGGGGKTPTALALGAAAIAMGHRPGFLSRGHGGNATAPLLVEPHGHKAGEVGDEPLLLAAVAPTAVAVDRKRGAALLADAGCDILIMDDGFQSARLAIDYAVLVVDSARGLGNGAVVPAGPLRAPLMDQIRHCDALLVVGKDSAGDEAIRRTARSGKPVFEARLAARAPERLAGRRVMAFAGIADPDKFYRTLRSLGADVAKTQDFPDHHRFSASELDGLATEAARESLQLVTTRKDAVRLDDGTARGSDLLSHIDVLDIDLVFEPASVAERFIRETVANHRRRRFG